MTTVISVENLSKTYRLGQIGTGTFTNDLKLWWAKMRGKPNPFLRIGETDNGNRDGEDLWALRDVSFTVEQGEVLGIIGRNGAGKSTLLKILSRVTAPTSGRIRVKGRVASLLEVGTGFHPELTGRENIYLNGAILGMKRDEITRKFDEIVDFAEVQKFIDTPVKRYSSGMYVRLAFAVAAHLEPEILVVDEVLAVGDAEFQKKCLGKMGEVAGEGRTVLFVSHNLPAVKLLCPKAILLMSGQIVQSGYSDEVISYYLKQNSKDIDKLLYPWDGRPGNGLIRFVDWQINDVVLGKGRIVGVNHECEFILDYVNPSGQRVINDIAVSIVIQDTMGDPIFSGATQFTNQNFDNLPSKGTLVCHFSNMPLLPETYQVYIWCSANGELVDLVENAGIFQVVSDDVFGTGQMPKKKHGRIVVLQNWKNY